MLRRNLRLHFYCGRVKHQVTHSWTWALHEKPPIVQLLKNFPAFYGTRKFITVLTRALHCTLSWARSIQSIPSYLSNIHFNIFHAPTAWSSQWSLLAFLHSSATHSCYMPCSSHPPWLDHSNYTWSRVQVMKLLIIQFSWTSCHFISLRSKYSQRPVLKHPQSMFLQVDSRIPDDRQSKKKAIILGKHQAEKSVLLAAFKISWSALRSWRLKRHVPQKCRGTSSRR
jgi:hypothetical protein